MNRNKLKLVVIGVSHKTMSISDLEVFQLSRNELADELNYFRSINGIEGVVIISTCNRVEFFLTLNMSIDPISIVKKYFSEKRGIDITKYLGSFYSYNNSEAAKHLFNVICGLDSMVLGEYQIQGQIKEAYSIACSVKTADKILHKLFHAAFRVGKSVRSETKIGCGKQSVSGIASQILIEKLLPKDLVAIIGVNQNTKIIVERLYSSGFSNLIFINRTLYKAEMLADQYSGRAFSLEKIQEAISGAKCIFSCTGSSDYIIKSDLLNSIYNKSALPKLIIDIAVPRDIEVTGISKDVEVFDLERLKDYLKNQQKEIAAELPVAEKIISDEINLFEAWNESQVDQQIAYYDEKFESLRQQFLKDSKQELSEDELRILEKYSRSLMHRLKSTLHQIIKSNNSHKKAG